MPERAVLLRGRGLHGGAPSSVRLVRTDGPLELEQASARARVDELAVTRTDRGVAVASGDGRVRVESVEHLFAALGGLGVRRGVRAAVDGDELPLLDGGALELCAALVALGAPWTDEAALVVRREATLEHGRSRYRFAPDAGVRLGVDVLFPSPVGAESASWSGDPQDFLARIAPARTFGWADEAASLRARGLAAGVELASVIVFSSQGVVPGCRPAGVGEVARHKLLDLVGDLALALARGGGLLRGRIVASAPGHAATHAVVAEALRAGVLGPAIGGAAIAQEPA